MQISATIITFNEEANIEDAVRSLSFADEIIVVDSESTDRTVEIAQGLGCRVLSRPWPGFSEQKQFAVNNATFDWVFSLDADERVSEALAAEIVELKGGSPTARGYKVPRLSYYMGRAIRHSGWYPDRQLRFFDRRCGRWNERVIHESFVMMEGEEPGNLKGDILHFSVAGPDEHHRMIGERYAPLGAQQMYASGRKTNILGIVFAGPLAFLRSYVLKLGFLDGFPGFCIARFAAYHAYLKHLMLWQIQNGVTADATTKSKAQSS